MCPGNATNITGQLCPAISCKKPRVYHQNGFFLLQRNKSSRLEFQQSREREIVGKNIKINVVTKSKLRFSVQKA